MSILPDEPADPPRFVLNLFNKLPPLDEARLLFDHFVLALHPTLGVLHLPSTRAMMEETYRKASNGDTDISIGNILMLFSIFAGSALSWTSHFLGKLKATQKEANAAFKAYTRLAISVLNRGFGEFSSSTFALASVTTLAFVVSNASFSPFDVHMLRCRCMLMAKLMGIDRLDTVKSLEDRKLKGYDVVEIEVQRRIWWHLVASDWLGAFSGNSQEGAYTFQPRHMNVKYPSNVDDTLITPNAPEEELPWSVATAMSAFLQRIKLADLCRQIVDALPSASSDSQEPKYSIILMLDSMLQQYLTELPVFFQLDPMSIQQSQRVCEKRPYVAWQRLNIHFSLHARLCRLHRPYHLVGATNPDYAYSRTACLRSAHSILDLRRSMDDLIPLAGIRPGRLWTVMQHVFMAALTLATDVSFIPDSPDAEAQKAKVMVAYQTLEKSREESSALMQGIQKNMQTLLATLQTQRTRRAIEPRKQLSIVRKESNANTRLGTHFQVLAQSDEFPWNNDTTGDTSLTLNASETQRNWTYLDEGQSAEEDMDELWSDFLAAIPDLAPFQWTSLLDDVDFNFDSV
ncbi:hypothetical protein PV08_04253 [Exophiala spinifera]|uniref:Transcription factor domain-containing protein n=1 Tax=Exophiala spinifera TaxID=91928 RepID=A0A0D1ZWL2_9EURO|nr:uncharacterized protein PV08_04253 [Exophiala spinifera]KIW17062.1 hypothetical protein PV08_04253 [Exophiala spinifera]